ncbi:MAG: hypothetical protein AAGF88_04525 [Pseudomonadota bacterium]
MRRELYASAALHGALLLWLVFGDALTRTEQSEPFEVTGVTLISAAEFDASVAETAPPVEALPAPEPEPEPEPTPEPDPEPAPEPDPEPAPEPDPEPAPEPEPVEDIVAVLPQPSLGDPTAPPSDTPTPEQAPIVAPAPAPAPEPEAEIAPELAEQPDVSTPSETAEPLEPETAPEQATTEIVTEAEEPSSAPLASLRPTARPDRPAPVDVAAEPEPEPAPDPEPEPAVDPIQQALEQALEVAPSAEPAAALGPALGDDTIAGFERQVGACWNLGASGTAQLETAIVVYFELERDGRPIPSSIRLSETLSGDATSAGQAFETARRAIIRCGLQENDGYDLPDESYERWRRVEAVFNPQGMQLR